MASHNFETTNEQNELVPGVALDSKTNLYSEEDTVRAGNERFVVTGYRDVWAVVAYSIFGCIIIGFASYAANYLAQNMDIKVDLSGIPLGRFLMYFFSSGAIALAICLLCIGCMYLSPFVYIVFVNLFCIGLDVAAAIYLFMKDTYHQLYIHAIVLIVIGIIHLIWLGFAWKRIPLAALLMKCSIKVIFKYPATIVISLLSLVFLTVHSIISLFGVLGMAFAFHLQEDDTDRAVLRFFVIAVTCLYFYWGSQIISNVVHVTVSGVSATTYFLSDCMPRNPTWKSLVRATTTSFGSICFGSLMVAIVQLIRLLVRSMFSNQRGFMSMCADCIMGMIENLMQKFNNYAFAYVAIYGDSYIPSAKKAWGLIKHAPCALFFNDTIIDYTMTASVYLIFLLTSTIVYTYSQAGSVTFICAVWVVFVTDVFLSIIKFSITSLFVCTSEAPDALQYSEPDLHATINEAIQANQ